MTTEAPSSEVIRTLEVLARDYGVRFLPKRSLQAPVIDQARVEALIVPEGRSLVEFNLGVMRSFLTIPAIADMFDRDHTARRRWQEQPKPGLDPKVYVPILRRNQLRVGVWTPTVSSFFMLRDSIKAESYPDYFSRLELICDEIKLKLNGVNPVTHKQEAPYYGDMSTGEKYEVMQFLEDRVVEVLGWFTEQQEGVGQSK